MNSDMGESNGDGPDSDLGDVAAASEREPATGYAWHAMFVIGFLVLGFLAFSLYRRIASIDPVQRCADAYESSYTAVDTSLVDRIKVRSPDGNGHTTCSVLRLDGSVDRLPRRELRRKTMP